MPTRMPDDITRRGSLPECRAVLAITRGGAVWYRSVEECRLAYGIRTRQQLVRLIDSGQVAPDGYTTFEDPIPGIVYEGMTDSEARAAVLSRTKKS